MTLSIWTSCALFFHRGYAMPKIRLTTIFIRAAYCLASLRKLDFFDTEQRSFMLEVRVNGRKTFYQRYTDQKGRTRQVKIRAAEVLTAEQAREKGKEILAAILLAGDPQQIRVEYREVVTFAAFARDRYSCTPNSTSEAER